MDVGAPLVAHGEAAELRQPGKGALHDPTMAAEMLTAFDPSAGDAILDVAAP